MWNVYPVVHKEEKSPECSFNTRNQMGDGYFPLAERGANGKSKHNIMDRLNLQVMET